MLVTTNYWPASSMINETRNEIRFDLDNNNNNNNSQYSQYIEPMWASLPLTISKL